jgi:hypothetical protein
MGQHLYESNTESFAHSIKIKTSYFNSALVSGPFFMGKRGVKEFQMIIIFQTFYLIPVF